MANLSNYVKLVSDAFDFANIILMSNRLRTLVMVCFWLAAWLAMISITNAMEDEPGSVLLVGNSFIAGVAHHAKPYSFSVRWVGGRNLAEHAEDEVTLARICGNHQFVVLQDSSTRADSNSLFQSDINTFLPIVESCDAVPVLLMTWETKFISFPPVKVSYEQAAETHGLQLIKVGAVWHEVRLRSESMYQSLLEDDGIHPSFRGQRLLAAAMLKAFCTSCYQSFNWVGFTPSERSFLKSRIADLIDKIVVPEPESEPIPEPKRAYLPAIIELLL